MYENGNHISAYVILIILIIVCIILVILGYRGIGVNNGKNTYRNLGMIGIFSGVLLCIILIILVISQSYDNNNFFQYY